MSNQDRQWKGWQFIDDNGTFSLKDPHKTSYLYFPLINEAGIISAITPTLNGDIKTGQNTYLTTPVSVEDLHNSRAARNFWVFIEGAGAWSVTGNSALQLQQQFSSDNPEKVSLEAGFLWHKLTRSKPMIGLRGEVINFVPPSDDQVELMKVTLTNVTNRPLTITPTAAIPMFCRSADNLRDHRHVTSLLHRIITHPNGVLVRPTLSFDERGHRPNSVTYGVLGTTADGTPPAGFFPLIEDFTGEGGNLEWPEAVVRSISDYTGVGEAFAGYEAMGALRFDTLTLKPDESRSYIIIMAVMEDGTMSDRLIRSYGSETRFDGWLKHNQTFWQRKLETLSFKTADDRFDQWMKWVGVQPILRRLSGNSFLPYHDYGRGGRGWRDLWQDSLTLLMMEPAGVGDLLWNYYAGIRIDGSNATIIGSKPGEFKADRNDIPRVWMDHGAWPFLTTKQYIDQTGDLGFLLRNQVYFKDQQIDRCQAHDRAWKPTQGTRLRMHNGQEYQGTILEHILVQHLSAFFNVGQHNNIKLEGADWNDGMDMAVDKGESVAFTALYAGNLRQLTRLLLDLELMDIIEVELAAELMLLLDTLSSPLSYGSVSAKQERLAEYFAKCQHTISGKKNCITIQALAQDLTAKAEWLYEHLRTQEWIDDGEGFGWFNGYYDNEGHQVEGLHLDGVRMTLTGQVFAMMGGIATDDQARQMVQAADHYLLEPKMGGPRLNSDFGGVCLNLGRCFGYAFGHKENGAIFSHMVMMWANALYRRGFIREGYRVLADIFRHCQDFEVARMYPGIPEYVNDKGRGMYPYLTGAASWLLLTYLSEVFGVRGDLGNLLLEPKLVQEQFDAEGDAAVFTLFAGKSVNVVYHNPSQLDYGRYEIKKISINGKSVTFNRRNGGVIIARDSVENLPDNRIHKVDVVLS